MIHSAKEIEEAAIALLNQGGAFSYLIEPIRSYESDLADMLQGNEVVIDGPRVWTVYGGSSFPRTDIDNAWTHNEQFTLDVIVFDHNYSDPESAASGDPLDQAHPGTRQMLTDVRNRLTSQKPFFDCMPFVPILIERINLPVRRASAYRISFQTEFDYGGPV